MSSHYRSPLPSFPTISAQAEHAHRDDRDADAVGELGTPKAKRGYARVHVGADDAEQQPSDDHGERLQHVDPCPSTAARDQGHHISENIPANRTSSATYASGGPTSAISSVPTHAGEERADRRDRQRRPGPALLGHRVAVEAGDDRRRSRPAG